MNTQLPDRLRTALKTVTLAPDLRSGAVGDHQVKGDDLRALKTNLGTALYTAFHAGHPTLEGMRPSPSGDPRFATELAERVPHEDTLMSALALDEEISPGKSLVSLGGVHVRIPNNRVERADDGNVTVRVPAVMPKRSPGFLLIHGSRGARLGSSKILRIYFNIPSPEDAPNIWQRAVTVLEEAGVPYQAKILSSRSSYPRRDALVVYLGSTAWETVPALAEKVAGTEGLGTDVSLYAAELAPGIGWAWEPEKEIPNTRRLSFGQHRSHAIAEALVTAASDQKDPETAVTEALQEAGIQPSALHLNLGSPDFAPATNRP